MCRKYRLQIETHLPDLECLIFCIRKYGLILRFLIHGFTSMKIKCLMNLIITAYNQDLCLTFIKCIWHILIFPVGFRLIFIYIFTINNFLIYEKLFPCYKDWSSDQNLLNVNKFSLVSILKNVWRDFSISTLSNNINKDFCDIM